MPTYVSLASWTEQGIRNVKDTVKRFETAKQMAGAEGVTLKEVYYLMGGYDA
ncbi:MAG: GYD domain-containing protein, partial [bacterium]